MLIIWNWHILVIILKKRNLRNKCNYKLCQSDVTPLSNFDLCRIFNRHILKWLLVILAVNFRPVNQNGIICQFEEDIETVASLIQKRSDMVIKSEKNYLKHIKQSGYRSYHLIIYYTVDTIKGPKKLQAEIQIRTMAMNFWATIEHSLQYKYKGDMPEHVAERLSKAADAINALDHEMSSVRNEIMDAQNSSQMQSNLVKDILINIENLYKIANKREIMKIQDEFLRVFKTKDLQQLKRFHRQLDIISEGYRAQAVYHHV